MTQYTHQFKKAPLAERLFLYLLGALAFAPIAFMSREIVTGNFANLDISNADVLGGGTFLLLLSALAITPLIFLTGRREFGPLRWWFGVMFAATAVIDLIIASIVTGDDFKGGFLGRIGGHTFLVAGLCAVLLSVAVAATANRRAQRKLGKYWKPLQRLTYVIWAIILIHLALLFSLTGARFLQAAMASAPLAILRIPAFQRWWDKDRTSGHRAAMWLVGIILLAVFAWGVTHLVGEEINRGINALSSHPADT